MTTVSQNNKRIAKNTFMLYIRTMLVMAISLYTSRVILNSLGVEDFGIYNVVGGVVTMLGIIKGVMAGGASRFLTFAIGKEDEELTKKTFSVCVVIHAGISLVFILLAETIGLWFLNTQLVISPDRIVAANWVYQFSLFSAINAFMAIPYNAAIIAHEKMNVFAYISVLEVTLKLVIVYALFITPIDRLVTYGFLMLCSDLVIRLIYRIYCKRNYAECTFQFYWDKAMYKEIMSYSSWNVLGTLAALAQGQGLNILLNMFFCPSVNAARGIAYQINNAINQFTSNFYTAVRPQITKYYAKGEIDNMIKLVFRSSKMSFYLMFVISLPVLIEAPYIVSLWLGQLPDHVVIFVRYIIAISILEGMAHPLMTSCHATGQIALYQSMVGIAIMLNVPVSYVFLKLGSPPEIVFQVSLVISLVCLILRTWLVKRLIKELPFLKYVFEVVFGSLLVAFIASTLPIICYINIEENIYTVILVSVISLMSSIITIYAIGLNREERNIVSAFIKRKIGSKK